MSKWICSRIETDLIVGGTETEKKKGIKNDGGKLLAGLVIQDFGLALLQVSGVGTYGASKYAPKNWLLLEEGERRYLNALMRHLLLSETEELDPETGISHLSHAAWNILAVVELKERRKDKVTE